MSSIKLTADSGGGTFEIKAPSSSANTRILTLPDTGNATVLTTDTNVGKILQIRHKIDNANASTTSTSYTNSPCSGLNQTITPIAASSKIIMVVHIQLEMQGANTCSTIFARDPAGTPVFFGNSAIASNSAPANTSDGCSKLSLSQGYGSLNGQITSHSGEDSPSYSVGDTLTYGILIGVNGNTAFYNRGIDSSHKSCSSIYLMEVAA